MDFDISCVLNQALMAHLSTVENGEPRDSPVWFIYEEGFIWLFGTQEDSFIRRLKKEPRCAMGIVEFELKGGILRHVGIRGHAQIMEADRARLERFVGKYLGQNKDNWNAWFMQHIVNPIDAMVKIISTSAVAKNVSYFKSGPRLAV